MVDDAQHSDKKRNKAPAVAVGAGAGAGILGGVGLSALFKSLDLAGVLKNPLSRPEYTIAILCFICFLVVVLSCLAKPPQQGSRRFAYIGLGGFFLIGAASIAIQYLENYSDPAVVITARFNPDLSAFRDPDTKRPVKLILNYTVPHSVDVKGLMLPFANGPTVVHGHDIIEFHYSGIDLLANKYVEASNKNRILLAELKMACSRANKDVCALLNAQMEDTF